MKFIVGACFFLQIGFLAAASPVHVTEGGHSYWEFPMADSVGLRKISFFSRFGNDFEAITELLRLRHAGLSSAPLEMKISTLYLASSNQSKSLIWAEEAQRHIKGAGFPVAFRQEFGIYLFDLKDLSGGLRWSEIQSYYKNLAPGDIEADRDLFRLRAALWLTREKSLLSAETLINGLPEAGFGSVKKIFRNRPDRASRWNLLYGLVPGGVYFRFGEWWRGFLSFSTVGILGGVAAVSALQGFTVMPVLAGLFAFRYYLDSLTQSLNFLEKYDEANWQAWREELFEAANLPTDRPFYSGFSVRFRAIPSRE